MSERTGEAIKNGKSRDTGNIECTRHKMKKTKNTTQKTKKMSNSDATKNKVITEKWRFTCGHSEYTILYYYCRKEDSKINSYQC